MSKLEGSAAQQGSAANKKYAEERLKAKLKAVQEIAVDGALLEKLREQLKSENRKKIGINWFSEWLGFNGEFDKTGKNTDTYRENKDRIIKEVDTLKEALKSPTTSASKSDWEALYKEESLANKIQNEDLLIERECSQQLRDQVERLKAQIRILEEEKAELMDERNALSEQVNRLRGSRINLRVIKDEGDE
ncbi:hypothetical protein BIZ37_03980 [Photobacterium sp. BZF1]|uniref:hypothetical protein n=1 Tax=Photobacterium sp. BZF1 TaxID=1904457 RepID=UPI001653E5C8|nr:hypothetical protein [Photobacterium sp. BZF1]MBC7001708.1 hypothetical protein [Photobacterium sp. BZF1]